MKKLIAILLCLVMVVSMVACGGEKNPPPTDEKVITIGVFEPTSGQNGAGGKKEILGIQYANSLYPTVTIGGEEYKIELTYADNQSDSSKAPTAAQQLVSKGVTAVLGTYGSSCAIAGGPYFEQAKIPAIGTSCTNPQVTQGNDYYFRVCFIDPFQSVADAQFAKKQGVIFSFLEGRRVTDLLASLFGLSIAVSSGTAKSIGLFVVDILNVSEFWMPALIGAVALPLLAGLGYILDHLPKPTAEDKALRVERVTLDRQQRWELFRNFAPVLTLLFFANLFLTVLQDVKEDFLVKIIDVNAAGLSSWVFAKVDGVVTLIILAVFATLALVKSHIKVLSTLLTLVIAGAVTLSFVAFNYDSLQLSPLVWLFIQSLCLYFSYLSFQTIFFDRFIACFRIRGNVGFFIAMVDSIGYTGTVLVLVFKECFNPNLDWLEFYNTMAGTVGIVCCTAFTVSLFYLMQRYRKGKRKEIREKATSCPVPSLASSY